MNVSYLTWVVFHDQSLFHSQLWQRYESLLRTSKYTKWISFFFFFLEEISSRFYCQLHPSVIVFHYASNDLPITYLESPILFGLLSHFGGRNLLESSREDFLLLLQLILAWKTCLQCCYWDIWENSYFWYYAVPSCVSSHFSDFTTCAVDDVHWGRYFFIIFSGHSMNFPTLGFIFQNLKQLKIFFWLISFSPSLSLSWN